MHRTTRRRFLAAVGGGLAGTAGCVGFTESENDGDGTTTGTAATTASGTTTAANTTTVEPEPTATGWTAFRADERNTGYHDVSAPTGGTNRRWRVDAGGRVVASPALANGTVYAVTRAGTVLAVDAATGETAWTRDLGRPSFASPAVLPERVLVATDQELVALDRATGAVSSRALTTAGAGTLSYGTQVTAGLYSSPTVADGLAYVGGRDGGLHVVDVETMTTQHRYALGRNGAAGLAGGQTSNRVETTPAVFDETVVVGGPDGTVTNLTVENGVANWFYDARARLSASPAVDDERVYVVGSRLVAVSRLRGEVQWQSRPFSELTTQQANVPDASPAVAGETVVVPVGDRVVAFDAASGDRQWRSSPLRRLSGSTGSTIVSSPAVTDDRVYVAGVNDGLFALSAADGSNDWVVRLDDRTWSSPAVGEGVVVVGDDAGSVHAFEAA